jgi:hypothetical protein
MIPVGLYSMVKIVRVVFATLFSYWIDVFATLFFVIVLVLYVSV